MALPIVHALQRVLSTRVNIQSLRLAKLDKLLYIRAASVCTYAEQKAKQYCCLCTNPKRGWEGNLPAATALSLFRRSFDFHRLGSW